MITENLKEKAAMLPDQPGVYLFKDSASRVIYVGKALSLRRRVRSYLGAAAGASPRLRLLQGSLASVDYVVTSSEVEALILECSLIKEYRPRFNINLKDDKDYPYLVITPELYPRLELLRLSQLEGKRGRYRAVAGRTVYRFGPYTDVRAVRDTMSFLGSAFPLRRCRQALDGSPAAERPCLNYQMRRCLGPCRGSGEVPAEEYATLVRQVVLFLRGRYGDLERQLKGQMEEAAAQERFEAAAALRDRLQSLKRVCGQQQAVLLDGGKVDRDVLALVREGTLAAVHLFQVREGCLLSQGHFVLDNAEGEEDSEALGAFLKSYYGQRDYLPPEIVLPFEPADAELLGRWLEEKARRRVAFRVPRRGALKKLLALTSQNGHLRLAEKLEERKRRIEEPLEALARLLGRSEPPRRLEGYDISHMGGEDTVGAMVVFQDGEPHRDQYRTFHIRQAPGGDDYGALEEVLQRRARREEWPAPDLLLIDGGRGQLQAARRAVDKSLLAKVPIIALCKDPDRLFMEQSVAPLCLAAEDPLLQLLQRLRDESHRFAAVGRRHRGSKRAFRSRLDTVPNLGPKRKALLLQHFGSEEAVLAASARDLKAVPGIGLSLAGQIAETRINT